MDESLLDLLICRIPELRGRERIELAKKFDREDDFLLLSKVDVEILLGRPLKEKWTMEQIRSLAENDRNAAKKSGIRMVSWRDASYPPLLREIYDPPALLYYRGVLSDPEKPLAAVVGTRKPTPLAAERAYKLGRELGEAGIPVVSGLALGIDSMAHRGNVEAGSPTVAVLGSGLDNVYPVTNRDLARRILESGGLIVSEYPPGTGPLKWNFPERNRIISALARGTVVVEAPEKSGALITAQFALDQDRDLWVDSIGLSSSRGKGSARLAQEGAGVINSAGDILAEWNMACKLPRFNEARNLNGKGGAAAGMVSSMAEYLGIKL